MKNAFKEFYKKTEEENLNIINNGIFIFDTNVLLNLYRYSNSTRKDWLETLEKLKNRVHIPYIVGLEFHKNRSSVILDENLNNKKDNDYLEKVFSDFEQKVLRKSKYSDSYEDIKDLFSKLKEKIKTTQKEHPDFTKEDFVTEKLDIIFKGSIGQEYSEEDIKKFLEEGKKRFKEEIPPGYKDLKDKTEVNIDGTGIYGDFIVWKSIMDFSLKEKKPIIFVTDDNKEDWWKITRGKTISPRVELIKEFNKTTSQEYLQYKPEQFLKIIKKKINKNIKDESIKETKEDQSLQSDLLKYQEEIKRIFNKTIDIPDIEINSNLAYSKILDNFIKYNESLNLPTKHLREMWSNQPAFKSLINQNDFNKNLENQLEILNNLNRVNDYHKRDYCPICNESTFQFKDDDGSYSCLECIQRED